MAPTLADGGRRRDGLIIGGGGDKLIAANPFKNAREPPMVVLRLLCFLALTPVFAALLAACATVTNPTEYNGQSGFLAGAFQVIPADGRTPGERSGVDPALLDQFLKNAKTACPQGHRFLKEPVTLYQTARDDGRNIHFRRSQDSARREQVDLIDGAEVVVVVDSKIACTRDGARPIGPPLVIVDPKDSRMADSRIVTTGDRALRIAFNADATTAYIAPNDGSMVTPAVLEEAVSDQTNCDAIFDGEHIRRIGKVKSAPLHTGSMLPAEMKGGYAVQVYCAEDRRERLERLPVFSNYPKAGRTYLTYSKPYGFQISYIGEDGRYWLWFPGNAVGLGGDWELDEELICIDYDEKRRNRGRDRSGRPRSCWPYETIRGLALVSELEGDPFKLQSGAVPYRLERCAAPPEFEFDRQRHGCG